jgi:hypothetical protein
MRPFALHAVGIDQPAAHLECAGDLVVLVLDHHVRPEPLGQQRPAVLRRRPQHRADQLLGTLEVMQGEQGVAPTPDPGHTSTLPSLPMTLPIVSGVTASPSSI